MKIIKIVNNIWLIMLFEFLDPQTFKAYTGKEWPYSLNSDLITGVFLALMSHTIICPVYKAPKIILFENGWKQHEVSWEEQNRLYSTLGWFFNDQSKIENYDYLSVAKSKLEYDDKKKLSI